MEKLVIYDSTHGNTKIIAEEIAKGMGCKAMFVGDCTKDVLKNVSLLIVGCPIQGWRPTEAINRWLNSLESEALRNVGVSSFDTRMKVFFHGDAAKKILNRLVDKGGKKISEPKVFYVKDMKGPLFEGEVEKAREWSGLLTKTA